MPLRRPWVSSPRAGPLERPGFRVGTRYRPNTRPRSRRDVVGPLGGRRELIPRSMSRPRSVRFHPAKGTDGPRDQRDNLPSSAVPGIRRQRRGVVGLGRRPAPRRPEVDSKVIKGVEQRGGDALPPVRLVHSELVNEHFQTLVRVTHLNAGHEPGRNSIDHSDEQVVPRGTQERGGANCCRWRIEQRGGGEHTLDVGHRTHLHAHNIDRSMLAPARR